ncbi:cytochrome P450 family protein [Skeletonema marinoi]|uniref:Cytochrome P450 family protein n=1 Tax=Skeletonema marinoi TaxID=267567 RepID=A0AAD8YII0_9STRA|nr:cytochrome P450 family protein [Skeletonema marinoi]
MLAGKRNLLLLNGKEWKYYQSSLKSALHNQIRTDPTLLQRITVQTTRTLVKNIQAMIGKSTSDEAKQIYCPAIDGYMKMITQDVFGLAAFSHSFECCNNLQLSRFAKAFESIEHDILDRCLRNTLLPQNLIYSIPTKRNMMLLNNRRYIRTFVKDIIHDRLSKQHDGNDTDKTTSKCDILDKLIETHVTKQRQFQQGDQNNEEDLIDIVLSILLAGYDTVTIALTYAVFLVSRHPHWEVRCLEEIRRRNMDFDDVHNLPDKVEFPLCRAIILETLRLTTQTECEEDYCSIPVGDLQSFLAFSSGARSCPGRSFAIEEASLALAVMMDGLKFDIDSSYQPEMEWKVIVQKPKGGVPANVGLRP